MYNRILSAYKMRRDLAVRGTRPLKECCNEEECLGKVIKHTNNSCFEVKVTYQSFVALRIASWVELLGGALGSESKWTIVSSSFA